MNPREWGALMAAKQSRETLEPGPFALKVEGSNTARNFRSIRGQQEIRGRIVGQVAEFSFSVRREGDDEILTLTHGELGGPKEALEARVPARSSTSPACNRFSNRQPEEEDE